MRVEPKEIIKSRRQTIALVIDTDGELIVRAPFYATKDDINNFIYEKKEWILSKSLEMKKRMNSRPLVTLQEGDLLSYLGKDCVIHKGFVKSIYFDGESFLVPDSLPVDKLKEKLIGWYKKEAARILDERVRIKADEMGVTPCGIRITSAKTRWGSCSYKNNLNFSWRLIMCPMEVIDYVVVHELSHIYHKDHSKYFWNVVSKNDNKYKEHEKWLKENERLMEVI